MIKPDPESKRGYASQRDFTAGPSTYSDEVFLKKISETAALRHLADSALVADLASGPGKLGLALQTLHQYQPRFLFVDASPQQIAKAQAANQDPRNQFVVADIRKMPEIASGSVDAAVARYTLKDLTLEEKVSTLEEINRIMKHAALLAVADMVAPNLEVQDWLNRQHSMKQEFEWRNVKTEGRCYIPTTREWLSFLHQAGFQAWVYDTHMSFVKTEDWVKGKQFTEDKKEKQLAALNKFILAAPPAAKTAFNIREENGLVKIDYPITIIRAIKP
jgi:ubiquinone/menaquinone biosynthesis C-methylase UbiE